MVRFFDVPGNFVFRSIIDYIYHKITRDTTGKVAQEAGEIEHRRWFSYFVSWRVNSKISLQNVRKIIVNGYFDWLDFLNVGATCLNQWQAIARKHTPSTQMHQIRIQLQCLSSVPTKIMDPQNMTPLTKFYRTLSQSNQMIIYVLNPEATLSHQFRMESLLKFAVYTVKKFINQKIRSWFKASYKYMQRKRQCSWQARVVVYQLSSNRKWSVDMSR